MRVVLKSHDNFKNEKLRVIRFWEENEHTSYFLPKYHHKLNLIEKVWGQCNKKK